MRSTLPDALLTCLSDQLATRIGLHFPPERWSDLERGITAAASVLGMPNARSCAHWLVSAPLTHREVEILASFLTVGETYFFREPRSFEVLERDIVPALLRARWEGERRLRIWSAGCCTGEEPYTIAMLLDRVIPDHAAWHVTVHATDINPVFLRKAAEGEYGEWSFRNTPAWIRDRYFHRGKGGRFRLDDRIRKRVVFDYLNLADDVYPSLANNTNAMDIIFCRNVLMYFSAQRAQTVIDKLHRSLVEGGWLIVSPAETSGALFSRFDAVDFGGAIFYQKDSCAQAPSFSSPVPVPATQSLQEAGHVDEGALPANSAVDVDGRHSSTSDPEERVQLHRAARDCADQGRLGEAAEWCRKAIAADKLDPTHYFLLSAIEQEQGQVNAAVQSLARALYLDPHFVVAHYALGNLYLSLGRIGSAQRHFDNALASLQAYSPDATLPESDGLTAGRLGEIIEAMQLSMPQTAAHS